jgi:subtilase family serine protease/subtilisin-like proprotein convertase family protein
VTRALGAAVLVTLLALAGPAGAQSDALLGQQWHLLPRDVEPAGASVRDVWPTTKGAGVVIGIVDDGVQTTHPDLQPNLVPALSRDFHADPDDADPNPSLTGPCNAALLGTFLGEGCQGTAAAGLAAARDNTLGGAGVAPRAGIAALRILGPDSGDFFSLPESDALLAAAIAFRNDAIAVKSFSWGAPDDGASLVWMGFATAEALAEAVRSGRSERGTVFVRAAGNGGPLDNCNFDAFASSRYTLAVGAVGDDALPAPYSERCSALFVVAPSSGGGRSLTTTDLRGAPGYDPANGDFTDRFGGTNAAAPIVSGVIALMLSARPGLTERDVKHILRQTSARLQPDDPGWTSGPFPHSETFGFGLVDALAAVTAARTWRSLGQGEDVLEMQSLPGASIPAATPAGVTDEIVIDPTPFDDFTVEHVSVLVRITHPRRGDLEITLISPAGVESRLATPRPADAGVDLDWMFGSVRHWGERAAGTWRLRVADRGAGSGPVGTFGEWTLRIHGTPAPPGIVASGRVTTASGPLAGVTLTFAEAGGGVAPAPAQTDAAGHWSQNGFVDGGVYTVTPSRAGFEFSPPSLTFDASRSDLDFLATPGCGATAIAPGQTRSGTLAVTDCRATQRPLAFADRFTFTGTAGQQVAIAMNSTALDTYLFLLQGTGSSFTVLASNDDSGNSLNARVPANTGFLTLPATGTYTIEATSFGAGAVGAYTVMLTAGSGFSVSGNVSSTGVGLVGVTLTFTRDGGGAAPPPVQTDGAGNWSQTGFVPGQSYTVTPGRNGFTFAPVSLAFSGPRTDLAFTATAAGCGGLPINRGQTIAGALGAGDCLSLLRPGAFADRYTFTGSVAQQVAITLTSGAFDAYLYLIGPGDTVVALNDDSGGTLNSRIPITGGFLTLPAAGTYTIEATSFVPGATGAYTVMLGSPATAGFSAAGRVTTTLFGTPRGLPGVTLTFARESGTGTVPAPVRTDAAGQWSQAGFVEGTLYRVTPGLATYTYTPGSRTFSNASATLDFAAAPVACARMPILVGQTVSGSLATTDCASDSEQRVGAFADQYEFQGVAGQQIAITMTSAAFDTFLFIGGTYTIPGGGGGFLAAVNDDSGGTLNSRIPINSGFLTLPGDGTFVIEATSFRSGATGAYTLSLTSPAGFAVSGRLTSGTAALSGVTVAFTRLTGTGPIPSPVLTDSNGNWTQTGFRSDSTYRVTPHRPGLVFSPAWRDFGGAQGGLDFRGCGAIPLPFNQTVTVSGALAATDCASSRRPQSFADRYAFNAHVEGQVAISMTSTAVDAYLVLTTAAGALVAENDDSGGTRNARIPANNGVLLLPADGDYVIEVTSFTAGATGAYTLTVASPPNEAFITSGRVTAGGLPQAGVTIGFTGGDGGPLPAPVVTDASGFWSQTFPRAMSGYRATATRAGFDYAPSPSAVFTSAQSNVNFVGTPSASCPATAIAFGQTRTGTLTADDCLATDRIQSFSDRYTFSLMSTAQVVIAMTSTTFDTYLYLRALDGTLLVGENDDAGGTTSSRLVFTDVPPGDYVIHATSYAGGTVGAYTLSLGPAPGTFFAAGQVTNNGFGMAGVPVGFARTAGTGAVPAAVVTDAQGFWSQSGFATTGAYRATPALTGFVFTPVAQLFDAATAGLDSLNFDASCPSTPIAFGQTRSGTITATDCRASDDFSVSADRYVFEATAGTPVAIGMGSTAFDTFLVLYGPDGAVIAVNDESSGPAAFNSRIPADLGFLELPQSGQYVIETSPLGPGATGAYSVTLSVSADRFDVQGFVYDESLFFGLPDATVTFTRVSGTGPVPAAVRTDQDGFWFQTGFAHGTIYRARVTVTGATFSPPFYDFAGPQLDLSFARSGAGCVAIPLASGQTRSGSVDVDDCLDPFFTDARFDRYTFTATAGTGVQVVVESMDFTPVVVLYGPDGLPLDSTLSGVIPEFGGFLPLPLSGTYVVDTGPFPGLTGSYAITLLTGSPVQAPATDERPVGGRAAGDAITAQFWTAVGEGAAEGGGVSADGAGAGAPAIAVDPVNGEIFMAWESGGSDIHVKKWNGATWVEVGAGSASGPGLVSANAGQSRFPSLAIKQATLGQPGQPVIAWIDDTSGDWEIYVREFNGTAWVPSGPGTPATGPGISAAAGAIATAEAGRPSLVAERSNLFVAYATDAGTPDTHRVVVSSLRPFTGWAPLAANPLGANVAAGAAEYTAPGYLGARAPAVAINRSDGNPISLYVTGNAVAASSFADVHARRWTPNAWGAHGLGAAVDAGISGGDPRPPGSLLMSPRIAVGPDGVPHAAWLTDVGGNRSIQVRRFSSAASAWQPLGDAATGDIFLPTTPGPFGPALALAVGRDNLPVLAWSAGPTGGDVHVRKFSPADGWHELGPGSATGGGVSDSAGTSRFPALAVDTHNNLNVPILAWLDASSGLPQVYVRRAVSNADLVVESVTLPGSGAAGQPLDVAVVVRNRGAVAAPAFAVGLLLSADGVIAPGADRLLATQSVTGGLAAGAQAAFTVRLTLPADVAPAAYFVGAFADLGGAVDEVDESNNGLAGPNALQVAGPDLVVATLNGPFTATPGQNLAVEIAVKNQAQPPGSAAASQAAIYLSSDPTPGTGLRLGAVPILALAAGASRTVTVQLMVPGNISPGTYFLAAMADDTGQVAESDEANNGFNSERQIAIVRPDLLPTLVTAPASGAAGQPLVLSSDVKNQAAAPPAQAVTLGKQPPAQPVLAGTAARFRVSFFLSASSTGVQPGDPLLGGRDVERLAPGVTSRASTTLTVPSSVSAGTYFVLAVADALDAVQEQDEGNNARAAANPIVIRQPDLVVTEVKGPVSGRGAAGQPLAVSVKVKNQALAPAGASAFRVGIYLSLDPTPGSGDFIGFLPVASLAAGVTTASLTAMIPVPTALLDNTYFLSAVADWDGRVAEGDEDNNGLTAAQPVTIGRADLIVTRVAGPASNVGASGQPLAVTLGVKNQGPAPAGAGPFRVGLYLSMTDEPGTGALIGNVSVTGVAPGATVTVPATVVLPASLAAGTYFLSAVADHADVVAESDELNNGLTAATQLAIRQPDLVLTRVAGPATGLAAAGQPLAVALGVKNQSTAPANAGPFRIGIYLSSDVPTPGAGLLIGNLSVNGLVAGALPLAVTGTVLVPASMQAGLYFLSAVADVDNGIAEIDEDNNGLTNETMQVSVGRPDLQVSRIAGPATGIGAAGQPLAVSLDVRNDAPVPATAGPFKVGVFLSSTNSSSMGTRLGTLNVTALAAGARRTLTATLPVPANVSAGSYFLVGAADVESSVTELSETNNELGTAAALQIRQPDLTVLTATGPTTWAPGQPFVVTASVRNLALAPAAAGGFRVGVFLDDATGTPVGSVAVTGLAAQGTTSLRIPVTVPPEAAPGAHDVVVVADHEGRLAESDEENNTRLTAAPVQVRRADLTVTALAGPPLGVRGRAISVANTVANIGEAPATGVQVSFFVSPVDATPGAGRLIGTRTIATLAAAGSPASVSAATTAVTLPANLDPGSYFLSAVVDPAGRVAEAEERDNGLTAPAQVLVTLP